MTTDSPAPGTPCPGLLSFSLHIHLQTGTGAQWRSLPIGEMVSSSAWQKVLEEAGQRGVPRGVLRDIPDEQSLGRPGSVLKNRGSLPSP